MSSRGTEAPRVRARSLFLVAITTAAALVVAPVVTGEGEDDLLRCTPLLAGDVAVTEVCPPWELLRNGGFELCDDCDPDAAEMPRNWSYVPYAWARQDGASWTQRVAHDGESALDLGCGADHTTVVLSEQMPVQPGDVLTWAVHVLGPQGGADTDTVALVTVELFTPSGSPAGGAGGYGSFTDGTWQEYGSNLTVPEGTGFVALQLECRSAAAHEVIAFDDAQVTRS